MNSMVAVFLIVALGYLLGSIKIKGLQLGTSGVLIVALIFGHFNVEIPGLVRDLGLVSFVTAVGFIAGPVFFRNFKSKATSYVVLGILIIVLGALTCVGAIVIGKIPADLAVGMMTGALTSTPGLAAAIETGGDMASVGYGIAYPFGVVGVVLFVQLIPKIFKVNMTEEAAKLDASMAQKKKDTKSVKEYIKLDDFGFLPFAIAVVLGVLLGNLTIPLPGGAAFSLGTSGGPLMTGLIMGHFMHVGPISISVPKPTLETMREFGLILFLLGAGTGAGAGFVEILKQYGVLLFFIGALMTVIPMIVGYFAACKIFKMDILNTLGTICGGMTSTPALGTLISVTKTESVAVSYAATYPVALIFVVLASQFISIFFG